MSGKRQIVNESGNKKDAVEALVRQMLASVEEEVKTRGKIVTDGSIMLCPHVVDYGTEEIYGIEEGFASVQEVLLVKMRMVSVPSKEALNRKKWEDETVKALVALLTDCPYNDDPCKEELKWGHFMAIRAVLEKIPSFVENLEL